MEHIFHLQEALRLAEEKNYPLLRQMLAQENEADIAQFLEEVYSQISPQTAVLIFRLLPKELAAEAFSFLMGDMQAVIVSDITDQELSGIVEELSVDDAVDMLEELPANVVKRVLKNAQPSTRQMLNRFLNYPENSAGSIMTAEFIDLRRKMTVAQAIHRIRTMGADSETIYTCYVIDEGRILDGVVTVRELLLARDEQLVQDVMDDHVICAAATDDREEVASLFSKYGFLALPVVDAEHRLVGIVTVDDAVEVMEQEATEDFERMAAMQPSHKPYLKTSVFALAKSRILWLLVLMVSGMITGGILGKYEEAFASLPILVTFIPMLTDTGGNAGSQSSTLVIRGMALAEIRPRDFLAVIWKEARVSFLVGAALSVVNFVRLIITYPGNVLLALTVAIALFVTVVVAKTLGGMLPMIAKTLKLDPAIMAAPLITTIVDAVSLMIYFTVAQLLFGMA